MRRAECGRWFAEANGRSAQTKLRGHFAGIHDGRRLPCQRITAAQIKKACTDEVPHKKGRTKRPQKKGHKKKARSKLRAFVFLVAHP